MSLASANGAVSTGRRVTARLAPLDSADAHGFATAKGLPRDVCQQQPGAPNSSSQACKYRQDEDVNTSVDPEGEEKTGGQEQDRSDGVGCDRVEDRRDGVHAGAVCVCVDSGASIEDQKASPGDDGEGDELDPNNPV